MTSSSLKAAALVIVTCLTCTSGTPTENDTKPAVYFSLIVSGGENGFKSSGIVPGIDIALEAVEDKQLLPHYNLTYETPPRNSKCSRTDSLDVFFKDVQSGAVPKIAVIGCGCSVATEPVAEISHYWNISQVAYAAALSSLSDRTRFKNFFRNTPAFDKYAPALLGLFNEMGWEKIAFISQNENVFVQLYSDHEELLHNGTGKEYHFKNRNIDTRNILFETEEDPVVAARQIFEEKEYHVLFLNCYSLHARSLICEALKRNMVYPHFAYITYGGYPEKWWTDEVAGAPMDDPECTNDALNTFIQNARPLQLHFFPEPDDYDLQTDAGFSSSEFSTLYENRLIGTEYTTTQASTVAFDALWTIALVLNYTEEMRLQNQTKGHPAHENCSSNLPGDLVPLNEFEYSNAFMGCVMKYNFYKVNFTGVSGPVRYTQNGTIVYTRIRLAQLRNESGDIESVRFGYLDTESNFSLEFEEGQADKVFPDGTPPDGTAIAITNTYHVWLVSVYYVLALCGVVFSGICFVFNFMFRKRRVIRLTTPLLNYVIVVGALLMYLSVFLGLLPSTHESIIWVQCTVYAWVYGIGYLLVYGTVLAKMWRVYQIFHSPKPNKTMLQTWHLLCVVVTFTGIGVALLMIRTVAQALNEPELVSDSENPQGRTVSDIVENYSVWKCYAAGTLPFILDIIIFIYLSLLQFVGIILAFQTRKVNITALNDSKSITALIYISSIVLVVIVLITFILRSYINISAAVFSGGIIVLATFFLVLIFVPKMVYLYRDPTGDKIFSNGSSATKQSTHIKSSEYQSTAMDLSELMDAEKIKLLNSRVKALETKVDEKNKRITELETVIKA